MLSWKVIKISIYKEEELVLRDVEMDIVRSMKNHFDKKTYLELVEHGNLDGKSK